MSVVDTLKARIKEAMKAKDDVAKNVFRVVLSDIQLLEARAGGAVPDAEAHKVIKKLISSNEATLEASSDEATQTQLTQENALLSELVPKPLSVDEIVRALETVAGAIKGAKADGPAMGIAMKTLKENGASVESGDVKTAVAQLRA